MTTGELWTFGHSTRSEAETISLLRAFATERVVDVRTIRGSRHNPQFGKDTLPNWLTAADIGYQWIEKLGGRRRAQDIGPTINAGWRNDSFHHYADYTLTAPFAEGLAELIDVAHNSIDPAPRVAIMCAEAVPWRCHRSLIATILVARGWQVQHMMSEGHAITHEIGAWGAKPQVQTDGSVTYPEDAEQ